MVALDYIRVCITVSHPSLPPSLPPSIPPFLPPSLPPPSLPPSLPQSLPPSLPPFLPPSLPPSLPPRLVTKQMRCPFQPKQELGAHGDIFVQSRRLICIRNKQHAGDSVLTIGLGFFSCITKILGRTETRTRGRICFQTIRSVRYISRDDRARIATCRLRTATDLRQIIL